MGHPARVASITALLWLASLAGCAEGRLFGPGFFPDRVPGLAAVRFVDEETIHIVKATFGPGSRLILTKAGAAAIAEADISRGEAFRLSDVDPSNLRSLLGGGSTTDWYRFIKFEGNRAVLGRDRVAVRNDRGRVITRDTAILYVASYGSLFD